MKNINDGDSNTLTLDQEIQELRDYDSDKTNITLMMNNSTTTEGTLIQNSIFRPAYRHAIIDRSTDTIIKNNVFDASRGGTVGISIGGNTLGGEGPFSKNVSVSNNTFTNFTTVGIHVYEYGGLFAFGSSSKRAVSDFKVMENKITMTTGVGFWCENVDQVNLSNNSILMLDGKNNNASWWSKCTK